MKDNWIPQVEFSPPVMSGSFQWNYQLPGLISESLQWNFKPPVMSGSLQRNYEPPWLISESLLCNLKPPRKDIWIPLIEFKSPCVKFQIVNSDFSNPSSENENLRVVSSGIKIIPQTSWSHNTVGIVWFNLLFSWFLNCRQRTERSMKYTCWVVLLKKN